MLNLLLFKLCLVKKIMSSSSAPNGLDLCLRVHKLQRVLGIIRTSVKDFHIKGLNQDCLRSCLWFCFLLLRVLLGHWRFPRLRGWFSICHYFCLQVFLTPSQLPLMLFRKPCLSFCGRGRFGHSISSIAISSKSARWFDCLLTGPTCFGQQLSNFFRRPLWLIR